MCQQMLDKFFILETWTSKKQCSNVLVIVVETNNPEHDDRCNTRLCRESLFAISFSGGKFWCYVQNSAFLIAYKVIIWSKTNFVQL